MDGIDGILLALEPVARNFGQDDLDEAVAPGEWLPNGNLWCRQRAHIRPQQSCAHFDGVRLDRNAVLEVRIRMRDFLKWLIDALAGLVELPAVVIAADPAFLH